MLREISGAKRDEVTGEWRRLHNGQLQGLCCSPDVITVIKSSGRMRWAGHVARMESEVPTGIWWGSMRKRDLLGDLGVDGRIILKSIFKK